MNRVKTGVAVIVVLVGVVLLSPVRHGLGALADEVFNLPQEPLAGPSAPAPSIPTLSSSEESAAKEIIASDSRLQKLLKGSGFAVRELGVWHTEKTLEKIGASAIISLPTPISIEGRWPAIEYDPMEASFPPYIERELSFEASNVTELMISIDLTRGRLVSIQPGMGSEISNAPDVTPIFPVTPD